MGTEPKGAVPDSASSPSASIKALIAPPADVEQRPGDFVNTTPGELVMHNEMTCDSHSGRCGCDRAFVGLASGKSTTIAVVTTISHADFLERTTNTAHEKGWPGTTAADVRRQAATFSTVLEQFEDGSTFTVKIGKGLKLIPRKVATVGPKERAAVEHYSVTIPCHRRKKRVAMNTAVPVTNVPVTCPTCSRIYDITLTRTETGCEIGGKLRTPGAPAPKPTPIPKQEKTRQKPSIPPDILMQLPQIAAGGATVSFKYETDNAGPVYVTDKAAFARWCEANGQKPEFASWPIGTMPDGLTQLPWLPKSIASLIAAHYGVKLEEW